MTGAAEGRERPTLLWQTYPLGVLGADQTGSGRVGGASLRELADWLPHARSLGADGLLLGPVFASLTHGYDTVTHHEIDDRLGTTADFDALVAAAGACGVGLVLDGAFAYASRSFRRLNDIAEVDDPWFKRDADGELVPWQGVDSLVIPHYGSLGYQRYIADVMTAWLDRGAAGWRLDSAWSVPASFWRPVLARVRQSHPAAWFLGQVFDDDLPPVINRNSYSSATEYALMHGTREWLSGGSVDDMVATLGVHRHNSSRAPVHTFLGNHDYARLADVIDPDLLPVAFALLLTLPGIPGVYYGDEFAVRSTWTQGGPDALLRPPMSPDAVERADGTASDLLGWLRRLGGVRRANPWLARAALHDVHAQYGALSYRVQHVDRCIRVYLNPTSAAVTFAVADPIHHVLGLAAHRRGHLTVTPHGIAVAHVS